MTERRYQVAIIGMGCRLPGGVENPDALARFLRRRGDGVRTVPPTRWSIEEHYDPDPRAPGKAYVRQGGFLEQDVFAFDPAPFGISPREADRLDPQQRLLLEVTWEAFEAAGIPLDALRGSDTAAFIGGFTQDHQLIALGDANRELIDSHTSVGASMTVLSNRLSYTFDWHGASATVDTACSSSLVAVHLASEEIACGRSALAVAGGVNVMLTPTTTIAMCKGQFLAPDGRSKSFDANADGYGRGEGAGVVVLKRLDLALRDGDPILAVICATGINQDGRTDGMPMPNGDAQLKLARDVIARSGLTPSDIAYVEAHGTGTKAGDPVEIRALGGAYGSGRAAPLLVGSIKSNIGHLEAAAGVTGLIKAVLSVSQREIFPLRELKQPNPAIPFRELNVELAVESLEWPAAGRAFAAVNSFGYGGTNAHVIIGGYEPVARPGSADGAHAEVAGRPRVVPLSGACLPALRARAAEVARACRDETWRDLASTLALHQTALAERAVILAHDARSLVAELEKLAANEPSERRVSGKGTNERKLLWVFTGMGPQRPEMGRQLYELEPAFRAAVNEADAAFRDHSGWSVLAEMLRPPATSRMKSNEVAQPANFVLQVGLVALLRDAGVPEHGMLGHSVGELAAAWATGCLSLREAARITFHRSRLQQKKAGQGGMLAVGADEEHVVRLLGEIPNLSIAAFNGPKSLTLAGSEQALERAAERLTAEEIFNRRVPVEVPYHSPELAPLCDEFMAALGEVSFDAPRLPLYSTADGARVIAATHDAEYWWRNARDPVLLQRALEAAMSDGYDAFIEIGPQPVLGASIREVLGHLRRDGHVAFTMRRETNEEHTLFSAVAALHANGTPIDWSRLHPVGRRVRLPGYPFQRKTHWIESKQSQESRLGRMRALPLLALRDGGPSPRFTTGLSRPSLAYLHDHRIEGRSVFPAAGYVEAALSACLELSGDTRPCALDDVRFERVFVLRPEASPALLVDAPDGRDISLYGRHLGESWERKAVCRLSTTEPEAEEYLALGPLAAALPIELDVERLYAELDELGLQYGPAFRRLDALRVRRDGAGSGALLARLTVPAELGPAGAVHPAVLDAAFHALLSVTTEATAPLVPTAIRRFCWSASREAPRWVYGVVATLADGSLTAELKIAGKDGRVLLHAQDLAFRPLNAGDAPAKHEAWLHLDGFRAAGAVVPRAPLGTWAVHGSARGLLDRLSAALAAAGGTPRSLETLSPRDLDGVERLVLAFEPQEPRDGGLGVVNAARELVTRLPDGGPRVDLVTLSAHALDDGEKTHPDQTALWGFARVVMTERPELALRLVDTTVEGDTDALVAALADDETDEELALRGRVLSTRRLQRAERPSSPQRSTLRSRGSWRLATTGRPDGDELSGDDPPCDEVEVGVAAAALHPEDLLAALRPAVAGGGSRMLRGRALGGRVLRVGTHVKNVAPGDWVHAFHQGEVASRVVLPAAAVTRAPAALAPAALAGCEPWIVAWHALADIARAAPGDAVLVLDATSPAGLACIAVGRLLGARVVAGIAREDRRDAVLAQGAAAAVVESDPDFISRVCALLPEGARAILGARSLREPALLGALGAGGHFIVLGAPQGSEPVRAEEVPSGASICNVEIARTARANPAVYAASAQAVLEAMAAGRLAPPPSASYPLSNAAAAFAAMSEGAEAPTVLELEADVSSAATGDEPAAGFRADRSYLVTGGLAGFGLATAEWMANLGAGTLVLASRRGVPDAEGAAAVERMRGAGAKVLCVELDVTDVASVATVLGRIRRECTPLAGIFHAATALADGPLETLTEASLTRAMAAKARGAWLLHEQTRADSLDYFVLYSSVSALIGNPNQAGYAAANAYLDGLAALRRAEGLPGVSVSFGAIKDAGIVARDAATRAHLASLGIRPMAARLTLAALGTALVSRRPHAAIVDMDWDRWASSFPATPWARLADLCQGGGGHADAAATLRAELGSLAPEQRRDNLVAKVRSTVALVLRLEPENLDPATSLRNHGLDSLMAIELQVALEKATGVAIPTIEILAGVSVSDLTSFLLARLEAATEPAAPARRSTRGVSTHDPSRPLRDHVLARICVQPPYFALSELVTRGDWVEAKVRPLAPQGWERSVVSCAEAARHLAILGSCAASLVSPLAGRVYYPVLRARYAGQGSAAALVGAPLDTLVVRARCTDYDVKASRARAETQLCDERGVCLLELVVDYHVIPERHFRELFVEHAQPTNEAEGHDPYSRWQPLPQAPVARAGGFEVSLGTVDPKICLGHFVGFPALPVSIMTRHAVELVARVREPHAGDSPAPIVVSGGDVETKSFVFSGQTAALRVWPAGESSAPADVWHCEVTGDGKLAASFRFDIRSARVLASGLVLPDGTSPNAESAPDYREAG